jgi:hypothetical protein
MMTRHEKISLIKDAAAGKLDKLKEMKWRGEDMDERVKYYTDELFLAACKYLIDHGPVTERYINEPRITDADLLDMPNWFFVNPHLIPDEPLAVLAKVTNCIDHFVNTNQLHLLQSPELGNNSAINNKK